MTAPTSTPPRHSCTCARLRKLTRRVTRLYDHHFAVLGITANQYSVLAHIAQGASTMAALADKLEMDRTTLTRLLKPLQELGWVDTLPGADARSKQVRLTPAGKRKHRRALGTWQQAQSSFEVMVGQDLIDQLHQSAAAAMKSIRQKEAA